MILVLTLLSNNVIFFFQFLHFDVKLMFSKKCKINVYFNLKLMRFNVILVDVLSN